MRRSLLVILIVAALSAWISQLERAPGATGRQSDWVRTADGWESRQVLELHGAAPAFNLHPGLVAAFQLGASILFLAAFPGRALPAAAPVEPPTRRPAPRRPTADRRVAVR